MKKGTIWEPDLLIGYIAERILNGSVMCPNLLVCRGGASFTSGYFTATYHGLPTRIQATILANELPASEDPSLAGQKIRNRVAEIREAALALGWKDDNP